MFLHVAWRPLVQEKMLLDARPPTPPFTIVTGHGCTPHTCLIVLEELVVVLWLVGLPPVQGAPHVQVRSENA